MTIKEFQLKLDKQVADLDTFAVPLQIAAFTTTAKMGERIFDDGKKSDESPIGGQYSTKPIYVNPNTLTVKKSIGALTGKSGSGTFKTGKKAGEKHKTKYLAGGYEELRDKVGRQTSFVDLRFSGELRMDFGNDKQPAEPRKADELEYQIRLDKDINQKKREGMEEKYGTIFAVSEPEKEIFFKTMQFEFNNRLNG